MGLRRFVARDGPAYTSTVCVIGVGVKDYDIPAQAHCAAHIRYDGPHVHSLSLIKADAGPQTYKRTKRAFTMYSSWSAGAHGAWLAISLCKLLTVRFKITHSKPHVYARVLLPSMPPIRPHLGWLGAGAHMGAWELGACTGYSGATPTEELEEECKLGKRWG